ncbi:hypothetical protein NVT87_14860 [Acinetobacter radioresistens]|jgi:hypothetical protein|uniref:Uncharacterized protein n=1 Tax=Acinetobacter lwoffii TaxID=28090 RepID=A0AAW8B0Q9_ACILW|nr:MULTISPECIES: hypothetical protein [Pseudomonadota]MCU4616433.1 hypothetical protein [Acinetobacter lwoffii]MCX0332152.1 hypothetical protein [Acinetobacter radioresistens]MDP1372076.1 hypothetical protein [Acinetobacter lwoffii]MDP1391458.1 hypothetical protein [Acinetobacter lwoffii]MDP1449160.1 hypothetical protein [Acinetobacter lwoffii]
MINPIALEIAQKLRNHYPDIYRVPELFLNIRQVSDFTPLLITGNKTVFSFKETGKSIVKSKTEIFAIRSTSQADKLLTEILSNLI